MFYCNRAEDGNNHFDVCLYLRLIRLAARARLFIVKIKSHYESNKYRFVYCICSGKGPVCFNIAMPVVYVGCFASALLRYFPHMLFVINCFISRSLVCLCSYPFCFAVFPFFNLLVFVLNGFRISLFTLVFIFICFLKWNDALFCR